MSDEAGGMNKAELIAFEDEIRELFNAGKIAAPIHLASGNEDQLIEIFQRIKSEDWVFGTWRSHYHCLLKGVPPEELKAKIVAGRSIGLCFPEHRILCSALVGGNAPLAVGMAMAIKRRGGSEHVWCFVGDMGATTGIFQECAEYSTAHKLPIKFVVENNRMSVQTNTEKVWGRPYYEIPDIDEYQYDMNIPHVGTGKWSGL
jgi:TPP-dependent pyruvate/acetoin dehydrogenase alpha subunit